MPNLKKMLNPDDVQAIEANNEVNWIPKNPNELLLPYVKEVSRDASADSDTDKRIKWTKEVIDDYSNLINNCRQLEAEIEERCKAVKVSLNSQEDLRIKEAMGRVFGIETDEITFQQYKLCIEELASLNNSTIPNPGD